MREEGRRIRLGGSRRVQDGIKESVKHKREHLRLLLSQRRILVARGRGAGGASRHQGSQVLIDALFSLTMEKRGDVLGEDEIEGMNVETVDLQHSNKRERGTIG